MKLQEIISAFEEIYDGLWLLIYVIYIILFLVFPSREVVKHQLPIASAMIVLLEQVGEERIMIDWFLSIFSCDN